MNYIDETGIEVVASQWNAAGEPVDVYGDAFRASEFFKLMAQCASANYRAGDDPTQIVVGGRSNDAEGEMTGRRETFAPGDWLVLNPQTGGWDRLDASAFDQRFAATGD